MAIRSFSYSIHPYDLEKTLESGQSFQWIRTAPHAWESVVERDWVRVSQPKARQILIETTAKNAALVDQLSGYFQLDIDLKRVLTAFPKDPLVGQALRARRGLRLLRQDPWICLASFLLSSTKQIVQIKEIVHLISTRHGNPVAHPETGEMLYGFPDAARIAQEGEQAMRSCKAGFRAKYLYGCARSIAEGTFDLEALREMSLEEARLKITGLPGVGPKIADCVLLFAYGFDRAFPVDVWVHRVLQDYYFHGKQVARTTMHQFIMDYFGDHAGYVQQYLFDYIRSLSKAEWRRMVEDPARPTISK